jgi:hypothetical protein
MQSTFVPIFLMEWSQLGVVRIRQATAKVPKSGKKRKGELDEAHLHGILKIRPSGSHINDEQNLPLVSAKLHIIPPCVLETYLWKVSNTITLKWRPGTWNLVLFFIHNPIAFIKKNQCTLKVTHVNRNMFDKKDDGAERNWGESWTLTMKSWTELASLEEDSAAPIFCSSKF